MVEGKVGSLLLPLLADSPPFVESPPARKGNRTQESRSLAESITILCIREITKMDPLATLNEIPGSLEDTRVCWVSGSLDM